MTDHLITRAFDKIRRKRTNVKTFGDRTEGESAAGDAKPPYSSSWEHNTAPSVYTLFRGSKLNGIKVLHAPSKPEVDIVFLHGLTGRADRTFFDSKTEKYWPVDLLGQDIPNARILSFGYNANVASFLEPVGQNTLGGHASNLVNDLARVRKYEGSEVPQGIIFVAHSLGGLVVKKAMIYSKYSADEHLNVVERDTVAIAFLGTPHRGSDIAPFAKAISNIIKASCIGTNTKILDPLKRDSQVLANVEDTFASWIRRNDGRVNLTCFYEELKLPGIRMVVGQDSAIIAGWPYLSIHANHMDMARFSSLEDEGYQRVKGELKRWIGYLDKRADTTVSYGHVQNAEAAITAYIYELGLQMNDVIDVSMPVKLSEARITEESMEWFTESLDFQNWKDEEQGVTLLWLHGDPRAGKTVIMSHILENLPRYFGYTKDVAAIFCPGLLSENLLVASLVFQLTSKTNRAHAALTKIGPLVASPSERELTKYLWRLLEALITEFPLRETVLLIDGIDKLEADMRLCLLNNLLALEKQAQSSTTLRILLSSRPHSDIQKALSHYVGIEPEKERQECLKTLFFQEWNARETRIDTVDGGRWLSSHEEYLKWSNSLGSDLLWIEGKPGSGKSTLSKRIVRKLREEQERADPPTSQAGGPETRESDDTSVILDQHTIVAEFYYSFRGGMTETSHELMLRSIAYQIWKQNGRLFRFLRDRYRQLRKMKNSKAEDESIWRYGDLKSALMSLHNIDFSLSVFIIVDGMDESDNAKRDDVLNLLWCLSSRTSNCIIKVLVASRPGTNMNMCLMQACHIVLQDVNKEDIRPTVDSAIDNLKCLGGGGKDFKELSHWEYNRSLGGFERIKDYIVANSQGVFLWVSLILKDLDRYVRKGGFTMASLEERVRQLPKELGGSNGIYQAIVSLLAKGQWDDEEQNEKGREEDIERGRRILTWVSFSKQPISIDQLADVLATPVQLVDVLPAYDFEQHRPRQLERGILSYCGTLVEVHPPTQVVQVVHQTVREFLLDQSLLAKPYHLDEISGDQEVAATCCHYMRLVFMTAIHQTPADDDYSQIGIIIENLSQHCLLSYSFRYFTTHLDFLGSNGDDIRDEFESFVGGLRSRPTSYASLLLAKWIKSLIWPSILWTDSDQFDDGDFIQSALVWASGAGRCEAVEILIALRADVNTPDRHGTYALENAAELGQLSIVPLLLGNGAHVYGNSGRYDSALQAAAQNGHQEIFSLLLQQRARLEDCVGDSERSLQTASQNGHKDIVQLLLDEGADVNARCTYGGTPLQAASLNGHKEIVQLLLDKGAVVNMRGGNDGSPLQAASRNGHREIVQLLLDRGAAVNKRGGFYGTAYQAASRNGHSSIVRLLHANGAYVNNWK